jgi:hypothetical protein
MKMLTGLLSYCAFVGVLAIGVMAGGAWLLRADPSLKAEAKAAVIPQKILDSIERKKPVPIPVVAAPILRPERPAPLLQEAPVSLPTVAIPQRPAKAVTVRSAKPKKRHSTPPVTTVEAPVSSAARVSTARTDFPY